MNFKSLLNITPKAFWQRILATTIALTILVVLIDLSMFIKIRSSEIPPVREEILTSSRFDLGKLRRTFIYYDNKRKEFEKINSGGTVEVTDPSLP